MWDEVLFKDQGKDEAASIKLKSKGEGRDGNKMSFSFVVMLISFSISTLVCTLKYTYTTSMELISVTSGYALENLSKQNRKKPVPEDL